MAKKEAPAVVEAEDPAAGHLDDVEFEPVTVALAGTENSEVVPESMGLPPAPSIADPDWTPYVLSLLGEDERARGRPKVPGLRRLVPMLVGDILENTTEVIQVPNPANGYIATVQARLVILWWKGLAEGAFQHRVFTGLADVYAGNTREEFARYPSSTAETRAEGRAIKKALALQVTTAEEMTDVPVEDAGLDGKITPTQVNFIDLKCKQNDINVLAFLGCYKGKYRAIKDVPAVVASQMIGHLSELQRERHRIPDRIKGYDSQWSGRD